MLTVKFAAPAFEVVHWFILGRLKGRRKADFW